MGAENRQTLQMLVTETLKTYDLPIEWTGEILALYPEYHKKSYKIRDILDLTALVCRRKGVLLPKSLKRSTTRKKSKAHRGYFKALNKFKGVHVVRPEKYVKTHYPEFFEAAVPLIKVFNKKKRKLGIYPAPRTIAAAAVYLVANKPQNEIGEKFYTSRESIRKSLQIFNTLGFYRRCIL